MELTNISLMLFGEEEAPAAVESAPDPGAEFDRLIEGDYREQYEAKTKPLRESADKYAALTPVLTELEKRYGLSSGDTAGLQEALSKEARDREAAQADRENARQQWQAQQQSRAQAIREQWEAQAEQAKQIYPGLDLRAELRDPRFQALLCADVDVATAYQVVHLNEILPAAMAYTAKAVEGKLAGALTAASTRPGENGGGGQGAAAPKLDASKMGKAEFQALCRRIAGGEKISFG